VALSELACHYKLSSQSVFQIAVIFDNASIQRWMQVWRQHVEVQTFIVDLHHLIVMAND